MGNNELMVRLEREKDSLAAQNIVIGVIREYWESKGKPMAVFADKNYPFEIRSHSRNGRPL